MKKTVLMMAMVLIGSIAMAQPPRDRAERNTQKGEREQVYRRYGEKMPNISDEQKEQMKQLRMDHLKATQATKNQLSIKRAELDAAIEADQSVDKLVQEINDLQGQLFAARIKNKIAMRNILDENQKLIFDQRGDWGNFHKDGKRHGR